MCGTPAEPAPMWSDGTLTPVLIALVLKYLLWALKHEEVTPAKLSVEWLDQKKDGSPGAVAMVLAKALLVCHIQSITDELPEESHVRKEINQVWVLPRCSSIPCLPCAAVL